MDPNELIKAAPELTKAVATLVAGLPIGDIVKRICGPPADLLGDRLKGRVERCFEKTVQMTQEAGFTPQAVPPKLLFPILRGASVEEDEDLHTMWAALLANAASPENADVVRPGFLAILQQMAPDEAAMLNWIYDCHGQGMRNVDPSGASVSGLAICLDGLEASQLIRRSDGNPSEVRWAVGIKSGKISEPLQGATLPQSRAAVYADRADKTYLLTDRGRAFVEACRAPKPKP